MTQKVKLLAPPFSLDVDDDDDDFDGDDDVGLVAEVNPFEKCGREADERAVRSNSCCWLKSQSLLGKYKLFDFLAFQIIMTLMEMDYQM